MLKRITYAIFLFLLCGYTIPAQKNSISISTCTINKESSSSQDSLDEIISLEKDFITLYSDDNDTGDNSTYYSFIKNNKLRGQVKIKCTLKKYKGAFTPISSLYLLQATGTFKPGSVLSREPKNTSYNIQSNYGLYNGYFKIGLTNSYDDTGSNIYYGAKPIIKACYPQSSTSTVSISSSFKTELGIELGGSTSDGFEGNGELKLSIGVEQTLVTSEPQYTYSEETDKSQTPGIYFNFQFSKPRDQSYTINAGVIFEMKNKDITASPAIYLEDEITLEISTCIGTGTWWFGNTNLGGLDMTTSSIGTFTYPRYGYSM